VGEWSSIIIKNITPERAEPAIIFQVIIDGQSRFSLLRVVREDVCFMFEVIGHVPVYLRVFRIGLIALRQRQQGVGNQRIQIIGVPVPLVTDDLVIFVGRDELDSLPGYFRPILENSDCRIGFQQRHAANQSLALQPALADGIFNPGAGSGGFLDINTGNMLYWCAVCYNISTGILTYDGTVGTCTTSDERLKNIGAPIDHALDKLLKITGLYFAYKDPDR
jgi:hypothetical protein